MKGLVHLLTKRYGLVPALLLIIALALVGPVMAADITISSPTSIAATIAAGSTLPGDTIILNPGVYYQNSIPVTKNIHIRANTAAGGNRYNTIIDAQSAGRIFTVPGAYSFSVDNLTLRNGYISSSPDSKGGAIFASVPGGTVTVTSSTITGCSAIGPDGGKGGAIYTFYGSTVVDSSTFNGCSAGGSGGGYGGAVVGWGGTVRITSSTFNGCSASGTGAGTGAYGGAIDAGDVTVTSSTFNDCSASGPGGGYGGAIFAGPLMVTSSTFNGCSASSGGYSSGGAIFNAAGSSTFTSSTFTGCSAIGTISSRGGAIYADGGAASTVAVHFSRIYQNNLGTALYRNSGTFDALDNWWGTNGGSAGYTGGGVTSGSWLVLGAAASPSSITTAQTSTVRANLTYNSSNMDTSADGLVPDGITTAFAASSGSILPAHSATITGSASTTFIPASAGTASLTATVDDQSVTVPVTVTDPAPPVVAGFSAPVTSGTAPLTVDFADASTGFPDSWLWNFGAYSAADGGISEDQNPSHTYESAGTYTVTLTANTTESSNSTVKTGYVTVTAPGTLPITAAFSGTPRTGDVPLTVDFTDASTGLPKAWAWSFGDGGTSTAQNPSHQYTVAGAYTVTLTAMNESESGTLSEPGYVTVTSVDMPVVANFANATPRNGTVPLTVQFTDISAGLPDLRTWSFGDGEVSSEQNPSHTYTHVGSYAVSLTATNTTIPSSNTLTQAGYVNVRAVPVTPWPTQSGSPSGPSSPSYVSSGGSDSGTGPAPVKQGGIVLFADSSYLAEHSVTPADIRIMNYAGGRWSPLETRFTGSSGNKFMFTADSDRISLLAIGNTKDGVTGLPALPGTPSPAPTAFVVPVTSYPPAMSETRVIVHDEPVVPAVQQTTAVPAPMHPPAAAGASGFPSMTAALIGAGIVGLVGGGWYVRRWWIQRQNPALFGEY